MTTVDQARATRAATRDQRKRHNRHRFRDTKLAWLLVAPATILLGIFVLWPAVYAVYL